MRNASPHPHTHRKNTHLIDSHFLHLSALQKEMFPTEFVGWRSTRRALSRIVQYYMKAICLDVII